jgi:hypothetical protein
MSNNDINAIKHSVYFSTEELMLLEKILYRHATVCTMVADAYMRKGDQQMMVAMDKKTRDIEDLASRVGYPLDAQWIEGKKSA